MNAHERQRVGFATVPEVAAYLKLSRTSVYSLMDAGALAYSKFGACRRVRWADVEALVERSTVGGNG